MSWMKIAIGGSAILGAFTQGEQAKQQAKQQKAQMLAQAAQTQYSPWTGAAINTIGSNAPNQTAATINGALQGGLTGGLIGAQFKSANPTAQSDAVQKATTGPMPADQSLTGGSYSDQLGQMGRAFDDQMSPWGMMKPNLYAGR